MADYINARKIALEEARKLRESEISQHVVAAKEAISANDLKTLCKMLEDTYEFEFTYTYIVRDFQPV